jgi:hypothetical protein
MSAKSLGAPLAGTRASILIGNFASASLRKRLRSVGRMVRS